jgi:hypothetical protein
MEKKKLKSVIIITLAISIVGSVFLVYRILKGFDQLDVTLAEFLPSSYLLSGVDSQCIGNQAMSEMKVREICRSKMRGDVALLTFEGRYDVVMYKIVTDKIYPLKDILHEEGKSLDRSVGVSYRVMENSLFDFQYRKGEVQPVSQIYLTIGGDSIQKILSNDSIIAFNSICKDFSIKYGQGGPVDIFAIVKKKSLTNNHFPVNIVFLRKDKNVCLFVLSPQNSDEPLSHNVLIRQLEAATK